MEFSDYYEAREIITEIMSKDLLGPVDDNEIICDDRPLDYYILGKLYPIDTEADVMLGMSSDDCGELDEENSISLCNGRNPSSFGISIAVEKGDKSFTIRGSAARYNKKEFSEIQKELGLEDIDANRKRDYWKREIIPEIEEKVVVQELEIGKSKTIPIVEGLDIKVMVHRIMKDGVKIITVTMTNTTHKGEDYKLESSRAFFQPQLEIIENEKNTLAELSYKIGMTSDEEILELNMLYHEIKNYASGHGCAVMVKEFEGKKHVFSDFFPKYEVKQMKPSTRFSGDILSMAYLSKAFPQEIINGLRKLTDEYEQWIDEQSKQVFTLQEEYHDSAKINLDKCSQTCERIKNSIECLNDDVVYTAFSLANKAMFEQRKSMLKRTGKYTKDENIRWYPFQLAFFIQEICSFAQPNSTDRKDVDLLWFPTGGGKTEAYLGIAAFVIFLRRLQKGNEGDGVTVLMRYTMRLLTFQQFERASSLICACESIRRRENIKGGEIGIGLWAGQALTPNKIIDAEKILKGEDVGDIGYEIGNPVQISRCPHCGAPLTEENYACDVQSSRMLIRCSSGECEFNTGLPVYLIDEEIYKYTPTYIVATIDKFAQVALKEECGRLFGLTKKWPPELIIQDELHLISGPLGTITVFFASTFWTKLQNIFGHCCMSKLDKVAKSRLVLIRPAILMLCRHF